MHVEQMKVEGIAHLIELIGRGGDDHQFLRELLTNAIESGATLVQFGPEWEGVKEKGVYRLSVADNGRGMEPDDLLRYMKTIGLSSKPVGGYHENFGMGARVSMLPWNKSGLLVMSWTEQNPEGAAVLLGYDEERKEYGAFSVKVGGEHTSLMLLGDPNLRSLVAMKPELIKTHGTLVVAYGDAGDQDTYFGPEGYSSRTGGGLKYISKYVNRRFWKFPVEVRAWTFSDSERALWPKEGKAEYSPEDTSRDQQNKIVKGARYFVVDMTRKKDEAKASVESGEVTLSDGTIVEWFYRHGDRPDSHAYGPEKGFIAVCYRNDRFGYEELYNYQEHSTQFRSFGIYGPSVVNKTTLVVRPPQAVDGSDDGGVYPDAARKHLLWKRGGGGISIEAKMKVWGEEFGQKMPDALVAALTKHTETRVDYTDAEEKRQCELRLAKQHKGMSLYLARNGKEKGRALGTENILGSSGKGGTRTDTDPIEKKRPSGPDLILAVPGGDEPAKERTRKGAGLPDVVWKTMAEMGETKYAVQYYKPSKANPTGMLVCAQDFPVLLVIDKEFLEMAPDTAALAVIAMVRSRIGSNLAYWVASSRDFARLPSWTKTEVEEDLCSQAVLTAKFCLSLSDYSTLKHRVATSLGVKRTETKAGPPLAN